MARLAPTPKPCPSARAGLSKREADVSRATNDACTIWPLQIVRWAVVRVTSMPESEFRPKRPLPPSRSRHGEDGEDWRRRQKRVSVRRDDEKSLLDA